MSRLVLALLMAAASGVHSEERTAVEADPLFPVARETIVVTAERAEQSLGETTAALTVITRKDIDRSPATNLAELLTTVPGMEMFFAHPLGGTAMLTSRGFFGGGEVEYVQLLVDGAPVGDAESGLAQWRTIAASQIERVEVLRGPGSALYGDTALGGVVQVFTRPAVENTSLHIYTGSFGSVSAALRTGWRVAPASAGGRASLDLTAEGGVSRTSGYRRNSSSTESRGNVSVRRTTARGLWSSTVAITTRNQEEPGPVTSVELRSSRHGGNPLFDGDREKSDRIRASASYDTTIGKVSTIRGVVFGSRRISDVTRTLLLLAGFGDRARRSLETRSFGGSLLGTAGPLRWGLDAGRDRVESAYESAAGVGGATLPRPARREKLAVFLAHNVEITPRFRIASGARFDSIDDDTSARLHAWSPRLAVNYYNGAVSAFAQWSRAFKAPTLDQLFDARPFPDFAGGTSTISNPQLSPQRARNVELGAARRTTQHDIDVVIYQTDVSDEIDFDSITFRYANIGRTLHRGVEASATFRKSTGVSPFFTYALTAVTPRDGANADRQLKNIPRHVIRGGVNILMTDLWSAQLAAARKTGRFLDDANAFRLEDATVVDVRAARVVGRHRVIVDLLNVTNEQYSEIGFVLPDFDGRSVPHSFPAAGFAVRLGLEARF